jgi:hypothetical protein
MFLTYTSSSIKCNRTISIDFAKTLDIVVEPENRLATIAPNVWYRDLMRLHYKRGTTSIFIAEQEISPVYLGIATVPFMKAGFQSTALQLLESGIFMFLHKNEYSKSFDPKPAEIGPQVLTLTHLQAGFFICSALLCLSVVVFFLEFAPKVLRKLFSLLLASYVVVKFTKMNKML